MLNENIKKLRKSKGLSQEELAIKLNVVRQTEIEKYLVYKRCIDQMNLYAFFGTIKKMKQRRRII